MLSQLSDTQQSVRWWLCRLISSHGGMSGDEGLLTPTASPDVQRRRLSSCMSPSPPESPLSPAARSGRGAYGATNLIVNYLPADMSRAAMLDMFATKGKPENTCS